MAHEPQPYNVERALQDLLGLRKLAVFLVRDQNAADDLIQEACAAFLGRAPHPTRMSLPYLRGMLRRLSARYFRDGARRHRREARVARRESIDNDPAAALTRAETKQVMAQALFALPDIYRKVLLLRFFENWTVDQIAEAEGLPAKTVYTRLNRGLDKIRNQLDNDSSREQWLQSLLPWIAASPAAMRELALSSSSATALATSSTAAGIGSITSQALTVGSLWIMTKSSAIVAIVALAMGLGIGFGTHGLIGGDSTASQERISQLEQELTAQREDAANSSGEYAGLERTVEDLRESQQEFVRQLSERQKRIEALEQQLAATEQQATELHGMLVHSAAHDGNEVLNNANWDEIAGATEEINALIKDLLATIMEGKPMSTEQQLAIAQANTKLQKFALDLSQTQALTTHVTGNGEFTHPVATANIAATMLKRAGRDLSPQQNERWNRITDDYDRDLEHKEQGYSEQTFALTKVLDEVELKLSAWSQFEAELSAEQAGILFDDEIRHRHQLDVLSPVMMTIMLTQPPLNKPSAEGLVAEFRSWLLTQLSLPEEEIADNAQLLDNVVQRWRLDLEEMFANPVPEVEANGFDVNDVVVAGRAYEQALRTLADNFPLDHPIQERVLSLRTWRVPRLLEQP